MERTQIKVDILVIAAMSFLLLFWKLGSGSVCSWDEGLYGAVSREIIKTGDWINLRWQDSPWSDKPPLYMWMTVLFAKVFGLNELSIRSFSALCGVGTVICTYLLAVRLYSRRAGFAAAMVLLSTWHFIWSSRLGMLDIPLTFFTVLAVLLFHHGLENKVALFFSPVVFGLAFMTKGWGAFIIPMILFLYIIAAKEYRVFKEPALYAGVAAGLILPVLWHWAAFAHYGEGFINNYFKKHLLMRTTRAVEGHKGGIFVYFSVIPNKGRVIGGAALALVPFFLWRLIRNKETGHILPLIWTSVIIIIFSLVRTKLHWYIMPVYPALALLFGVFCEKLLKKWTVPAVLLMMIGCVSYLAMDKGIFDLDYSPETKVASRSIHKEIPAGEHLFLYAIGDPGLLFYLGDISENIKTREGLEALLGQKSRYILISKDAEKDIRGHSFERIAEYPGSLLIRSDKGRLVLSGTPT